MKIFVLEAIDLTTSYHSSGGLVVVAKDIEQAKALVATYKPTGYAPSLNVVTDEEWAAADVYELRGSKHEPKVRVFPDAGCC